MPASSGGPKAGLSREPAAEGVRPGFLAPLVPHSPPLLGGNPRCPEEKPLWASRVPPGGTPPSGSQGRGLPQLYLETRKDPRIQEDGDRPSRGAPSPAGTSGLPAPVPRARRLPRTAPKAPALNSALNTSPGPFKFAQGDGRKRSRITGPPARTSCALGRARMDERRRLFLALFPPRPGANAINFRRASYKPDLEAESPAGFDFLLLLSAIKSWEKKGSVQMPGSGAARWRPPAPLRAPPAQGTRLGQLCFPQLCQLL